MQTVLAVAENDPAGQLPLHNVAPVLDWYIPAAHLEHAEAPEVEYVPARQLVHTVEDEAPVVVEYMPAAHEVHEVDAEATWYVPTVQLAQLEAAAE